MFKIKLLKVKNLHTNKKIFVKWLIKTQNNYFELKLYLIKAENNRNQNNEPNSYLERQIYLNKCKLERLKIESKHISNVIGDLLLFGFYNNMNIEETLLYLKNGYTNLKIQSHKK